MCFGINSYTEKSIQGCKIVLIIICSLNTMFCIGTLTFYIWWTSTFFDDNQLSLSIMDYVKVGSEILFTSFSICCLWANIAYFKKKYAMQILSILGWISTLTMTIAIAIALALVIIHDIHAILLLIPGQNSEELYVAPPARNLYLAFIIIPLIHALLYAIISGLALGLSARMGLTLKITLNSK